jgi:hypothetical protein
MPEEAALLSALYPRFRCKISGARADCQPALLAALTAAKAAAEAVLRHAQALPQG